MDIYEKVKETAMQSGMWQTGYINTRDLLFYPEIRKICKENSCRNYGTTWALPQLRNNLGLSSCSWHNRGM